VTRSYRAIAVVSFVALLAAGCGSSAKPGAPNPAPTSETPSPPTSSRPTSGTLDPNAQPNPIPYNVGEMIGLPGGWRVEVTRVQRGFTTTGLGAPPAGQDHVAVDLHVINEEGPARQLRAAALFVLYDMSNAAHNVIALPGVANGLDGTFGPGTDRSGRLIFAAPLHSQLRMILDGQALGSQESVFQIDPPNAKPRD
jgi:hypothetical protein